jgi:uridine kinase
VPKAKSPAPRGRAAKSPAPNAPRRESARDSSRDSAKPGQGAASAKREPRSTAGRGASDDQRPVIIGISGGTGSGKTTVARQVANALLDESVIILHHDSYYHDRSGVMQSDLARHNFDHPEAFDTALFVEHLRDLLMGRSIEKPVYDFKSHRRLKQTEPVAPAHVILVEGILVLENEALRGMMDIRLYVEADDDERFIRRLRRDITERGRSVDSAIEQYLGTVKPMHLEFVAPSKRYADIIIPGGGYNSIAIDLLVTKIRDILAVSKAR